MRPPRRFAAPVLALLVALGASGCAGLSFAPGCGLGAADPMADGASRMHPAFQRHQLSARHQAFQHKAVSLGAQYSRDIRRPGSLPVAQTSVPGICFR